MIFLTEPILLININIFDINIAHVTINDIKLIEKLSFLSEIIINISKIRKERIYNICIIKMKKNEQQNIEEIINFTDILFYIFRRNIN